MELKNHDLQNARPYVFEDRAQAETGTRAHTSHTPRMQETRAQQAQYSHYLDNGKGLFDVSPCVCVCVCVCVFQQRVFNLTPRTLAGNSKLILWGNKAVTTRSAAMCLQHAKRMKHSITDITIRKDLPTHMLSNIRLTIIRASGTGIHNINTTTPGRRNPHRKTCLTKNRTTNKNKVFTEGTLKQAKGFFYPSARGYATQHQTLEVLGYPHTIEPPKGEQNLTADQHQRAQYHVRKQRYQSQQSKLQSNMPKRRPSTCCPKHNRLICNSTIQGESCNMLQKHNVCASALMSFFLSHLP